MKIYLEDMKPLELEVILRTRNRKTFFRGWSGYFYQGCCFLSLTMNSQENIRKNMDKICRQIIVKYVQELTRKVEEKLSAELPNRFALVIDGWTDAPTSTHYLAVLPVIQTDRIKKACNPLLAFSPLIHEGDIISDSHLEFITSTLEISNKDLSAVSSLIGDNVNMNIKLARDM